MNKRIFKIAMMTILIFSTFGCGKSETQKTIFEDGYELIKDLSEEKFQCEELSSAKTISTGKNIFLTEDGSLYRYDIIKKYSNGVNCEKIEYSGSRISTIVHNRLYDEEKNLLYIYADDILLAPADYKINDTKIEVDYDFLSNNRCGKDEYIYTKENEVFLTRSLQGEIEHEKIFEVSEDEKIVGLYGAVIKTDKSYYTIDANDEDCLDDSCTSSFKRSLISDIYDDVLFVSQDKLVDKDGNVYEKDACNELID